MVSRAINRGIGYIKSFIGTKNAVYYQTDHSQTTEKSLGNNTSKPSIHSTFFFILCVFQEVLHDIGPRDEVRVCPKAEEDCENYQDGNCIAYAVDHEHCIKTFKVHHPEIDKMVQKRERD